MKSCLDDNSDYAVTVGWFSIFFIFEVDPRLDAARRVFYFPGSLSAVSLC